MRSPKRRLVARFGALCTGLAVIVLTLFAISAKAQEGESVYWVNPVSGQTNNGDWAAAENWTTLAPPDNFESTASGPPTANETAVVGNAPPAVVQNPGATADLLIIEASPTFFGASQPGQVIVSGAGASLTLLGNAIPVPPPEEGEVLIFAAAATTADPPSLEILQGSLTVENGGTVNAQGVTISNEGQLNIGAGGTAGTFNATTIANSGVINFNFTDQTTLSAAVSGTGTLTKLGAGTLTLTGNNTYSGGTTINGGTVIANSANAFGSGLVVINNGSTLDNFGTISAPIGSTAGGANLINESGAKIVGNIAFGSSASNVTVYTGSAINGNLNLGTNSGSNLILNGTGTATLSQAITGTVTDAGSLTKQGSGTWIINTPTTAATAVNVNLGTLQVDSSLATDVVNVQEGATLKGRGVINLGEGTVFLAGVLAPGDSPGTLTIQGNYTQTSTGSYNVLILSPTNFTQLVVTGHATLAGTLRLTLGSGYVPVPGTQFAILTAAKGITGQFQNFIGPQGQVYRVTYNNGSVELVSGPAPSPKKAIPPGFNLSDGTPSSTTAIMANSMFYGFGGLSEEMARSDNDNTVSVSFDGGTFDFEGHHGEEYGFPITGGFKITDRVRLEYQIPLEYVQIANTGLFETGLTLDLPVKMIIPKPDQPFSWDMTPAVAVAAAGSREIIGAGALTNTFAYRFPAFTLTYGNYISTFEGDTLSDDDEQFPIGVDQRILKNGLKVTIPFGKGWVVELYGIYTEFLRTAPVSSYVTAGFELGRHFVWNVEGKDVDLGYLSLGLYTEQGNRYSAGHFRVGSAWRF